MITWYHWLCTTNFINQSCSRCVSSISNTSAFIKSFKPTPRAHVRAGPLCPKPPETHGNERARPDNTCSDRHHWRQSGPALTGSLCAWCSCVITVMTRYEPISDSWWPSGLVVSRWTASDGGWNPDGCITTGFQCFLQIFSPLWNR